MPTVFTIFGLRFMFYSDDHEPVHVHVVRAGNVDVITARWQEFFKDKSK